MLEGDEMWSKRSRNGLKDEKVLEVGRGCILCTHIGELYGALGACLGKGNSDLTECKYKGPEAGIAPGVLQELQGDQGGWRGVDGLGSEWIRSQLVEVCILRGYFEDLGGFGAEK